jgi:hypothetical protein
MRQSTWFLAAVCLLAVAGCTKQPTNGRQPVSGKVTLKGAPLDSGSIQFLAPDTGGALSGGVISNGEYSIPARQGLPVGKYKVVISAAAPGAAAPAEEMPGEAGPEAEERIPPEYNVNSDITVEVAADKENVFNFDIP